MDDLTKLSEEMKQVGNDVVYIRTLLEKSVIHRLEVVEDKQSALEHDTKKSMRWVITVIVPMILKMIYDQITTVR